MTRTTVLVERVRLGFPSRTNGWMEDMKCLSLLSALLCAAVYFEPSTALSAPAPFPKRGAGDGALMGSWTIYELIDTVPFCKGSLLTGSSWNTFLECDSNIETLNGKPPWLELTLSRSPNATSGNLAGGEHTDPDNPSVVSQVSGSWTLTQMLLIKTNNTKYGGYLLVDLTAYDPMTLLLGSQFFEIKVVNVLTLTVKHSNNVTSAMTLFRTDNGLSLTTLFSDLLDVAP